ncbi:putative aromatic acid transporter [Sphingobium sp. SYK-6]|uniref:MFS transporter n=1 Tax=Sphingobium sp. (strain NBRC 103272 / SYK-6) TaxID=627192 RepID=UPI0002277770|nr:MFS transporter [Sphingobium sp. SYK-6]BAK66235.1 putative aromatic acid transporter [Sphingobium sp. SYK-6]
MTRPARTIDLATLLDGRKLTPFNYLLICLSWLVTLFDGLDMMMMSFTAPYMQEELLLSDVQIGNAFSAGTLGMVVGGLIFTYVGDRIGRRPTIIMCTLAFGILTFLTGFATNYPALLTLRFLDGLAIGGALPLAWALNVEFVPPKMRATVVAFIMMGFSIGSATAAPLTNWLGPLYGWEGVYFAGGIGSVVCAIAIAIFLPESPRFLVSKGIKPELVSATLKRLDPAMDVQPGDRFVLGDEKKQDRNFRFSDLFVGNLRLLTPIIWIGYGASALGIFFKSAFGPLVLERMDVARETAANVSAIGALLGAISGVVIMRLSARYGLKFAATCTLLIVPMAVAVGMEWIPRAMLLPTIVVQGMLVGGCHAAIISQLALYYPSAIRASAGGWASAIGKIGGIVGPLIGGAILASGIPAVRTYAIAAICPFILFLAIIAISVLIRRPERQPPVEGRVAPAA